MKKIKISGVAIIMLAVFNVSSTHAHTVLGSTALHSAVYSLPEAGPLVPRVYSLARSSYTSRQDARSSVIYASVSATDDPHRRALRGQVNKRALRGQVNCGRVNVRPCGVTSVAIRQPSTSSTLLRPRATQSAVIYSSVSLTNKTPHQELPKFPVERPSYVPVAVYIPSQVLPIPQRLPVTPMAIRRPQLQPLPLQAFLATPSNLPRLTPIPWVEPPLAPFQVQSPPVVTPEWRVVPRAPIEVVPTLMKEEPLPPK